MKQKNSIALSLFLLTTFVSSFFIQKYSEGSERLPAEIESFYRDFNFVSSFSTPKERSGLIYLSKLPPKDRPEKPLPKRLKKVQKIVNQIKDRIWRVDPGMVVSKLQLKNEIFPAELVEIDNFRITKDGLFVRVTAYSIQPRVNLVLVAQYESYSGDESKIPSVQDRLELVQTVTPMKGDVVPIFPLKLGSWYDRFARMPRGPKLDMEGVLHHVMVQGLEAPCHLPLG